MRKRIIPPIEGNHILLRLLKESDLPMTLKWRNQDHIRKWFVRPEIISPSQHHGWFRQYLQLDNDYLFVIEETKNLNRPVGQISIYNIDWTQLRGEFGRLLIGQPEAQGQGIAKHATGLLVGYAFVKLGLDRVDLEVFCNNKPAIAIYRAYGFDEVSESDGLKRMTLNRANFAVQHNYGS